MGYTPSAVDMIAAKIQGQVREDPEILQRIADMPEQEQEAYLRELLLPRERRLWERSAGVRFGRIPGCRIGVDGGEWRVYEAGSPRVFYAAVLDIEDLRADDERAAARRATNVTPRALTPAQRRRAEKHLAEDRERAARRSRR